MSNRSDGTLVKGPGRHTGTFFIVEAVVLLVLGGIAIFLPLLAGIAITLFLGWVLLFAGLIGLISTFATRHMPGFFWSLVSALLALTAGAFLIVAPSRGLFSITLVLIAFFFADGLVSVLYALSHRRQLSGRWEWGLTSGLITILLAVVILSGLPASAAWALGLLVGLDMVLAGSSLLAMGLALNSVS
jgi:uncharacterized membrane protein HdeD (DUF308 family)